MKLVRCVRGNLFPCGSERAGLCLTLGISGARGWDRMWLSEGVGPLWGDHSGLTAAWCSLLTMWSFLAGSLHRGHHASEGDRESDELVECRRMPSLDFDPCMQFLVQRWRALCCRPGGRVGGQTFLACRNFRHGIFSQLIPSKLTCSFELNLTFSAATMRRNYKQLLNCF